MRPWAGAGLALLLAAGTAPAQAPASRPEAPPAADLLFETPQLANVPPGSVLTYRYHRAGGTPGELFGPPIEDTIRLTIEPGQAPGERTVIVQMFTGALHRAAGPFDNTSSNPALLLFLEHHLGALASVVGGNPRYLKNAIRAALRDKATVTPALIQVGGKAEPGWVVEVQPFLDDPKKDLMRGLHSLRLRFQTAEAVPGHIVSITAEAEAPEGKLLDESLTFESVH
ncbi:hypothetical protein [Enterovirga sp. CN4-39]|uniref:hypothetical protein n=1 Tax=Enterovirga sp. CN4-39 TaxID=3400910 RepID=UPI003C06E537